MANLGVAVGGPQLAVPSRKCILRAPSKNLLLNPLKLRTRRPPTDPQFSIILKVTKNKPNKCPNPIFCHIFAYFGPILGQFFSVLWRVALFSTLKPTARHLLTTLLRTFSNATSITLQGVLSHDPLGVDPNYVVRVSMCENMHGRSLLSCLILKARI